MEVKECIVEWYEQSGVQGGSRGLTINFDKDLVTSWNGTETTIAESLSDVIWALDMNIKSTTQRNEYINKRLHQTDIIREQIPNGYKETIPPNDVLRVKLTNEMCDNVEFLDEVTKLRSKYKGGQNMIETRLNNLKKEHTKLHTEYGSKYGSNDGSRDCERILDKLRDIETTFRVLGFRVQDYKIR